MEMSCRYGKMLILLLNDKARKSEPFSADTAQSFSSAVCGSFFRPGLAFQIDCNPRFSIGILVGVPSTYS